MTSTNITNLDLGSTAQFVSIYLGPSLGNQLLAVYPELDVTSAAALAVPMYASRILLKAAVKAIALPPVAQWIQPKPVAVSVTSFDQSLWLKDLIGAASVAAPIVVSAHSGETIDGLATYSIITPNELLRLYPMTQSLAGWYRG